MDSYEHPYPTSIWFDFISFISLEVPHVVSQDSLRPYPWPRSTSQCSSQPEHEVDDDSKSDQVMTAVDMSDSTRASGLPGTSLSSTNSGDSAVVTGCDYLEYQIPQLVFQQEKYYNMRSVWSQPCLQNTHLWYSNSGTLTTLGGVGRISSMGTSWTKPTSGQSCWYSTNVQKFLARQCWKQCWMNSMAALWLNWRKSFVILYACMLYICYAFSFFCMCFFFTTQLPLDQPITFLR